MVVFRGIPFQFLPSLPPAPSFSFPLSFLPSILSLVLPLPSPIHPFVLFPPPYDHPSLPPFLHLLPLFIHPSLNSFIPPSLPPFIHPSLPSSILSFFPYCLPSLPLFIPTSLPLYFRLSYTYILKYIILLFSADTDYSIHLVILVYVGFIPTC